MPGNSSIHLCKLFQEIIEKFNSTTKADAKTHLHLLPVEGNRKKTKNKNHREEAKQLQELKLILFELKFFQALQKPLFFNSNC